MRQLRRPTVSLPTLVTIRNDFPVSPAGSLDGAPEGKWNDPDVRGAIFASHGRVCAYCQRAASDSRGDVEHFRPQSVYPWLVYDFTNYLLGCRVCNSTRKSNRFPLFLRAKPVTFQKRMATDEQFLRQALAKEKRLLLDPVEDPVDQWVDIDFDDPICPITLTQAAKQDRRGNKMVTETIEFFGFNIIPELIEDRFTHVNAALDTLEAWRDGDVGRADELRKLANRYKPHGWAVRRLVTALAPDLVLATAEEDLKSFVNETLDRLDRDDRVLAKPLTARDRKMVEQRKREASWTLAVLWKEPPAGAPDVVGQWISDRKKSAEIDAFRQLL